VALTPAAPATAAAFPVAMDGVPLFAPPPLPQTSQLPQLVAVGRGFGHGIGMSQWGALAMAQRGDSYAAILRHYYRGTQLRPYSELALTALAAGRP
jgi:stage II sporulation protein D